MVWLLHVWQKCDKWVWELQTMSVDIALRKKEVNGVWHELVEIVSKKRTDQKHNKTKQNKTADESF